MSKIVPFGKYKGQPVEALVADREYAEWALAQPWFRERFRDVYQVVINYGAEPQETPEHNAMQARFLDDGLCLRLWRHLAPKDAAASERQPSEAIKAAAERLAHLVEEASARCRTDLGRAVDDVARHKEQLRQLRTGEREDDRSSGELRSRMEERWLREAERRLAELHELAAEIASPAFAWSEPLAVVHNPPTVSARRFEEQGWDVKFRVRWRAEAGHLLNPPLLERWEAKDNERRARRSQVSGGAEIAVECKPSMGDDFPSVLRQVKHHGSDDQLWRCVVVGSYAGVGASFDQVRTMFAASGIALVLMGDLH